VTEIYTINIFVIILNDYIFVLNLIVGLK